MTTFSSNSICLTKLDILDTFEEVKVGVSYKLDGKILDSVPGETSVRDFLQSTPSVHLCSPL